ncbi:hypothetical protein SLEP1_g41832 [Rubroshorea leprosula]|uniref:Uncharacterized protein n=1 Tax=Rubroshorea leprosula TaxID=152421 RepID=A0AAV5L7V9_9ROSI|nr:hypothetical protein SLEP1_g41832 [Rubroshorea leprosula]
MPLDYGSMDTESSPSPSSSERTVEERLEQRVVEEVEEDEDEIPSSILEAGNRVDGCYDSDLDIVSEGMLSTPRPLDAHIPALFDRRVRVRGVGVPTVNMFKHFLIIKAGGRGEKGWYHFGPRSSSKENKNLFSPGPSSIKGWKENFFFVDDTEWSRRDAEVEQLFAWKAKKTKQNNYKLNEDEVEEVKKLVREDGDVVDILYLTSQEAIDAAELYGPSSLGEDGRVRHCCWGPAHPQEAKEEVKDFNCGGEGGYRGGRLSSISAQAMEVQPRPEPMMGGSEDVSEEMAPLQRKKRRVAELETRGDEVVEFVPRSSPLEINPEDKERGEVEVRGLDGGRERTPPHVYQKSLFEATNKTGAKHFLNATLPEVDRMRAKDEVVSHAGYTVVRHALEEKGVWEKEKRDMQRRLDEVLPSVTELQNKNGVLSTKLVLKERKRKICEEKVEAKDKYMDIMRKGAAELKKNVNLLVYNGMEEHIGNFLNSSTFENILKLYRLPTAILAFTDCRKKVKAQYPEITLRWERDAEGRTIFPPTFDAELVAVEGEEEEEGEEEGAQGAGVEDQATMAEVQPPEVQPVSSDKVQLLALPEAEVPPLPTGDAPSQPPLPAEEQPPPPAK